MLRWPPLKFLDLIWIGRWCCILIVWSNDLHLLLLWWLDNRATQCQLLPVESAVNSYKEGLLKSAIVPSLCWSLYLHLDCLLMRTVRLHRFHFVFSIDLLCQGRYYANLLIKLNCAWWRCDPMDFVWYGHGPGVYYLEWNVLWLLRYTIQFTNINVFRRQLTFRNFLLSYNFKLERLKMLFCVRLMDVAVCVLFVDFIGFGFEYNIDLILRILKQAALIWQHLKHFRIKSWAYRFHIRLWIKVNFAGLLLFLDDLIMMLLLFLWLNWEKVLLFRLHFVL